ncbi:MAG: histidinol-phosphate transaminase [Actinomycetes bacterium]|jgi:histidinol-phosphate aminotransferase|nr:MAG: histidinol-phosphate transaminase [Actinomycetota bacterium]
MPILRPEIDALSAYEVGRPIDDVARQYGVDPATLVKLTANESPFGPFPGVAEAIAAETSLNRYPDNQAWDLGHRLAGELGVAPENLLFGNGSTALIADLASAVGGPGTKLVYPWPSFIMYRYAAAWAGMEAVEVPLDAGFRMDLDAMADAIDDRTRMVMLCNPNNPTGTIRSGDELEAFIRSVPGSVLVVVDEAYAEFVEDPSYRMMTDEAVRMPNVVTLHTFSKIYSLAGLRIGYAVGHADTLRSVRKAQQPLTVNRIAQAAALASLGQPDELRRRVEVNSAGRHYVSGALAERGLRFVPSHTNFVFFEMPGDDSRAWADAMLRHGVLVRPMSGGWMRVTIGLEEENRRFVEALDAVLG